MSKRYDLTGQKFGRLTVIEKSDCRDRNKIWWKCKCECGNEKLVSTGSLNSKNVQSCGCLGTETSKKNALKAKTHGLGGTRIYYIWHHLIDRCINKNNANYENYGGRGIQVCNEWLNNVEAFSEWASNNGYADNLEIDRIDTNGNYEPNNCRFVTRQQNSFNTRKMSNSKNKYKGINKRYNGKYNVTIMKGGIRHYLGTFDTQEEAARAYDEKAKELFGEYAHLNFDE